MKKKNSGFTLVELLVTIVVLGIITGFSIPLIRNIRESQIKKQYETYRTSLSYASKVYVDSFSEDLFGHDEIACATVSYNQLKSKSLIKDIPIDGVSCASNDTYVRIVKFEGQYSYLPKITCGKPQADGTISKDVEIPEGDINSNLCGLNVPTKIDIKFHPESSHTPNVRRKNITVDFKSPTGIHSDPIIYWAFSDKADFSTIIGDWKKLDLDIPSKKKQKALILQGNTISLTKEFITPKNYSGKLYLVLKIDRLQDLGGKNWTTTDTDIVSGGYYAVDNEPPKLNDSKIEYSKPVHRQVIPTLDFKATDNLTSEGNLRMCISEDTSTDNCSKNINDIKKKQNGWVTYNKSKKLPVINNASNGENHNIFISIGDQAGNYVSQQFVYYKSPVDYSITYSLDGGTHGTNHPSRVDFDEEFTVDYPTKKIKTIFVNNVSECSTDYSSSTVSGSGKSVNYTFNGWNITGMDNTTHTFGSRTSKNTQESNVKETKFKGLRQTSSGVVFTATWIPPQITLPKATKKGYTCIWTSPPSYTWASGAKYTPAAVGGATERTFTASCSPGIYKITLNKQSGSGGTSTIYEKYNTGWYSNDAATSSMSSITKPTRTGYTFGGYYTATNGGGTQVINASGTILSNKTKIFLADGTLYAKWTPNTFTVAYNKNGGTSGSTTSHTCTYDATCTARANGFAKTGYSFNGWKKGNAGSTVAAGASIKNAATSGTVTYYAQWKANTFTVAYNANGGSGTTASHTCTYDGTCTTRANGFSKTGYRFTGWKKGNAGGLIAAGASIKNAATSGTVTYYAQWQLNCDSSKPYWNGKACYANLQAALNGTAANGTIQLMTNTSDSSTPTSTKAGMKLVLNGHTLTKTSQPISVTGGSLTITNGTITANIKTTLNITGGTVNINGSSSSIVIKNTRVISSHDETCQTIYLKGATLNMSGANANIQAGSASNGYARTVLVDSGTFNMTGGKIVVTAKVSGKYGPVGVNVHGRFTMSGGSITASTISDGYAVSANKNGKVNITGGSVTATGRGKNDGIGAVVNTEHAENSCVFIGSGAKISCTSSRYCVAGHKTTIRIQSGATISTSNVKTAKKNTKTSSSTC